MPIVVKVPGTCGELVQGILDEEPFLITCPINLFSAVEIKEASYGIRGLEERAKSQQALQNTCRFLGVKPETIGLNFSSEILPGKGMSSSSADIGAICKAVSIASKKEIDVEEIMEIATDIEPTDGVYFEGIVCVNYLTGEIIEDLGEPPAITLGIFDCGGTLDTLDFHRRPDLKHLNRKKERMVKEALQLVLNGFHNADIEEIGEGTMISSYANQEILYKEDLPVLWNVAQKYGAVGVTTAHSGTIMGVMFPQEDISPDNYLAFLEEVRTTCPDLTYMYQKKLLSGGFYIEKK